MAFSWSLSKHIKISIIYLKRELFVVAPLLAPAAWFQWPAVTSLVWCCSGPITAVQCLPSGAQCGDWDCCRQQLLLLTRVNCEHVNTEQCSRGKLLQFTIVWSRKLWSVLVAVKTVRPGPNSQQSSPMLTSICLLYIDIHNMNLIPSAKQFWEQASQFQGQTIIEVS